MDARGMGRITMAESIFLSASVPDIKKSPEFAATVDVVAVTAAVSALVHVILGRRLLVWGGHPAITPMIWIVAQDINVDYGKWVCLYQSNHFKDDFPEDNERFQNIIYTNEVDNDREKSLLAMRERMFSDHDFSAAVFIGGMEGIVQEFDMFQHFQPKAAVIPIVSTGGAVLNIAKKIVHLDEEFSVNLDYVALFHHHLGISVREERFYQPEEQPVDIEQRYWPRQDFRD